MGKYYVRIDKNLCINCKICVQSCPIDVFDINSDGTVYVAQEKCSNCGTCITVCPSNALSVSRGE